MRKKTVIRMLIVLLILMGLHLITFSFDSKRISESKNPLFVIKAIPTIKDGGSAIYYGIGYQVIRWHKMESDKRLLGYEMHRIPYFKSFETGPGQNVKYVDYYTHN